MRIDYFAENSPANAAAGRCSDEGNSRCRRNQRRPARDRLATDLEKRPEPLPPVPFQGMVYTGAGAQCGSRIITAPGDLRTGVGESAISLITLASTIRLVVDVGAAEGYLFLSDGIATTAVRSRSSSFCITSTVTPGAPQV